MQERVGVSPQGIPVPEYDPDAARSTIRLMVGPLESIAVLYQAFVLLQTTYLDQYTPVGRAVMITLAVLHVLVTAVMFRTGGPFARGGIWPAVWIAITIAVPALASFLVVSGSYASNEVCVQACTYPAGSVLIAAFYPWGIAEGIRRRRFIEASVLGWLLIQPLALALLHNGYINSVNVRSILSSALWVIIAAVIGKAVGRMCRNAYERQLSMELQKYQEFFDFLHSNVKSDLEVVREVIGNPEVALRRISDLENTIRKLRIQMSLVQKSTTLSFLLSERIKTFRALLSFNEVPSAGNLTLDRPTGIIVNNAISDLFANCLVHGGKNVMIDLDVSKEYIALTVSDDGPGFSDDVMDDELTSIHRLRQTFRQLGGDLIKLPVESGTSIKLKIPNRPSAQ
ncbi:hypothetical protein ACFPM7_28015 [Actinokineospora guangxiensis]|uniref:Signal transduction histidine kinase n=1 Tax=Actinokineospora guangxiensis TaxID=1490288 RepID=A0ABW0EWR2_9PSEU